jgi:hypothetical protein
MSGCARGWNLSAMSRFILHHRHTARECRIVFASFKGFASPLRRRATVASCGGGGHEIWWELEADSDTEALGLLPRYVAERTTVIPVDDVVIP